MESHATCALRTVNWTFGCVLLPYWWVRYTSTRNWGMNKCMGFIMSLFPFVYTTRHHYCYSPFCIQENEVIEWYQMLAISNTWALQPLHVILSYKVCSLIMGHFQHHTQISTIEFPPVRICKSHKLSFQVPISTLRCRSCKWPLLKIVFLFNSYTGPPICINC